MKRMMERKKNSKKKKPCYFFFALFQWRQSPESTRKASMEGMHLQYLPATSHRCVSTQQISTPRLIIPWFMPFSSHTTSGKSSSLSVFSFYDSKITVSSRGLPSPPLTMCSFYLRQMICFCPIDYIKSLFGTGLPGHRHTHKTGNLRSLFSFLI